MAKGYKTGGRKPNTPNKFPTYLKRIIMEGLEELQKTKDKNFAAIAKGDPAWAYEIAVKICPKEIQGGDEASPIRIIVEGDRVAKKLIEVKD